MVDDVGALLRRPNRADARRNFDALLVAAAEAFAEMGTDVALDEVARRAGVGNATLYRNFATRRDLIVAVCVDEVAALVEFGSQVSKSAEPVAALRQWMVRFIEHIAANAGLAAALMTGSSEDSEVVHRCNNAISEVVSDLLDHAQSAGLVGESVRAADLVSTARALALVAEADGIGSAHRILDLVFDGLGPR